MYPDPSEDVTTGWPIESSADGARGSGGPPTRLRYIVGSALESLSRLRLHPTAHTTRGGGPGRSPAVEELVTAERVTVNVVAPAGPDLPAAAHPSTVPSRIEGTNEVVADRTPVTDPTTSEPDFLAAANLCTELGRVENTNNVQPLLQEAARILDATGLIVWVWDELPGELTPALAHGYSDKVLAQIPAVRADADNATAAAFRSTRTCAISGDDASGALVVPMLTPAGCAGVLAMELRHGGEQARSVRAVATIFAAQLAQLISRRPAEVRPPAAVATLQHGSIDWRARETDLRRHRRRGAGSGRHR